MLEFPIFNTICLLSSSLTVHLAVHALRKGQEAAFRLWWALTFLLGTEFIVGTGLEWRHLIYDAGLTIHTNLFGTTYYSLVGLHASHVIVGLVMLLTVLLFSFAGKITQAHAKRCEVISIYWHFVDAVWIVVFTVVYIIGR